MKDKKNFANPTVEIIEFNADDVILTSIIAEGNEGDIVEGDD